MFLQLSPQGHQDCFFRNKKDTCFQVWPALDFTAQKDYQAQLLLFNTLYGQSDDLENQNQNKEEGGEEQQNEGNEEVNQQEEMDREEPKEKEKEENLEEAKIETGDGDQDKANLEKKSEQEEDPDKKEEEDKEELEEVNEDREEMIDGQFFSNGKISREKELTTTQKQEKEFQIKKIQQLLRKVKDEEEQNQKKYFKMQGSYVEYGNHIQLLHVQSGCFLEGLSTVADEDNSCNKCMLASVNSTSVHFIALGGFKYKQEGEKIHYNDQIILKNVRTNMFLHVTERLLKLEIKHEAKPEQTPSEAQLAEGTETKKDKEESLVEGLGKITPKKVDRREPPSSYLPQFEANMSNNKSKFQILVYKYYDEDPDNLFIQGGMIVRLLHSERGGFLHSDDMDFTDDGLAEVYLWNFKGRTNDLEARSSSSLFEIELAVPFNNTGISNENILNPKASEEEKKKDTRQDATKRYGQVFRYSQLDKQPVVKGVEQLYRLRHLNTGRLVIDQEIEYKGIKIRTLGLSPHVELDKPHDFSEKSILQVQKAIDEIDVMNRFRISEDLPTAPKTYNELDQRSLLRIISTSPSLDNRIKINSCVQIQHVMTDMFLSYKLTASFQASHVLNKRDQAILDAEKLEQSKADKNAQKVAGGDDLNDILFWSVDDDDIQSGARDAVELKPGKSNEDAFFIIPEDDKIIKNILFIQISIDQLKKYLPTICSRNLEIQKEKLSKILEVFKNLLDFLLGDTVDSAHESQEMTLSKAFSKDDNDQFQQKKKNFKIRQKLMRELYVVESLVHIIYLPFSHGEFKINNVTQDDVIVKICQKTYNIIKLIAVNYYQNELYVSQWINLYISQAMSTNYINNIGAEDCIISLVDNNQKLLEQQITPQNIEKIVSLCKIQERDQQLIQLLRAICSCNMTPIINNQNDIIKIMLMDDFYRQSLMMPVRMKTDQTADVLLFTDKNGQSSWMSLQNYKSFKKKQYGYFLSLVDLSAELCLGRNQLAVKALQDMYNFDTVKIIVKDRKLPFEMRALFMRILLNLHMDQKLEAIQIPQQTGVWNELPTFIQDQFNNPANITYQIKQSKIQVPNTLSVLKKFVETYLYQTNGVQNIFQVGKNMMTLEILKIIQFMLNHGFYINLKELKEIAIPMINLLNGANDIYYENEQQKQEQEDFNSVKRYFTSEGNDVIVQSKIVICENLLIISQLEVDGKGQIFFSKFKSDLDLLLLQNKMAYSTPETEAAKRTQQSSPEVINQPDQKKGGFLSKLAGNLTFNQQKDQSGATSSRQVQNQNVAFLEILASSENFETENQDVYICVLFDLLLYKNAELSKRVFELLVRLFARKRILLENLQSIQMLENPRSIFILGQVKKYFNELKKNTEDSDTWLNSDNVSSKSVKIRMIKIFEFFAKICLDSKKSYGDYSEDEIEEQEHEYASDLDVQLSDEEEKNANESSAKRKMTAGSLSMMNQTMKQKSEINKKDFILFETEEMGRSNKENQRLLGSFQIENMAMFFIKYRVERNSINDPYYQKLIESCYRFLIAFVKDNLQNQILVHNNIEIFLRDIDKNPLICMLIYEMFKDNKRFLTLNVSKILRQIIISVEQAALHSSKKALYLKLLEVFCKYEEKIIRPNQQEIVIQFTKDIAKNNLIYLFSYEGIPYLKMLINDCIPEKFITQDGSVKRIEVATKSERGDGDMTKEPVQIIPMSMEIFNVRICISLMSLCCEGKSDIAESRCHSDIINMQTACGLYKSSGRYWPIKSSLINYVSHCYLDSSNVELFHKSYPQDNFTPLKELLYLIVDDLQIILDEWNNESSDYQILLPDGSFTSFQKEARIFAMEHVCTFLRELLINQDIQLNIIKVYRQIIVIVARLYYKTESTHLKTNAMELLKFVNGSDKYSYLLDNVQHPANQNIYLADPGSKNKGSLNEQGQKSSQLSSKLIQLAYSPDMIDKKEREFENLVLWVTNIGQRISFIMEFHARMTQDTLFSPKSFDNVSFEPIVCSLMKLLDSQSLKKDLHITGLTLLRKIVEVENKEQVTPSSDWEGEDWSLYEQVIEAKQNSLVEIGCVQFLCKHIQEIEDEEILEQTFLVCITLLLGGNLKSQDAFYHFFLNCDPFNIFMLKLKSMLMDQFDLAKKFIADKNAKLAMVYKERLRIQTNKERREKEEMAEEGQEPVEEDEPEAKKNEKQDIEDNKILSFDQNENNENDNNNAASAPIDEMFVINQIKTQYIKRTMRLLRFIQLLTEGHNSDLQNFLREQKHANGLVNQKSFDFISYVAQMLAIYEKQYINCYSCELGMQLIDTLVEVIQGPCKENQKRLVEAKIIDCCRDLIQQGQNSKIEIATRGFTTPANLEMHESLKRGAINLLLSIIEGSVEVVVYQQIADSFDDFKILTERLKEIYEKFVEEELELNINATPKEIDTALNKDSFKGCITEGFNIFCLINQLAIELPQVGEKIQDFSYTAIYQFFIVKTGNVEIQKDNEIIKVYFPLHPVSEFLTEQTKQQFNEKVPRQSNTHKILYLIKKTPSFIDEMEHLELRSHDMIKITPGRLGILRDFSTIMAVLISFTVIGFYEYDKVIMADGSFKYASTIPEIPDLVMTYLGYIQLATSVSLLIGFCVNKINIILKSGWREKSSENRVIMANDIKYNLDEHKPPFGDFRIKDLPLQAIRTLLLTQGPDHPSFYVDGKRNFGYTAVLFEYWWICLSFMMQDADFIFSLTYMVFSLQGLIQSPIFYSCHLADVINRKPQLKSVIKAVTLNGSSIMMTAMLGLIIIYIYSVFAYQFVSDTFYDDDVNNGQLNRKGDSICMNMIHCFLSTFNYGLRAGGGIGEMLPTNSAAGNQISNFYFKSVYNTSFFVIIKTILLNIIFGIIIDTFAQLREINKQADLDVQSVCFICNIDNQTLNRETEEGFAFHIDKDHNVWSYLEFIIHLKSIHVTELNGTESYILDLFKKDEISWYPMQKSLRIIINRKRIVTFKQAQIASQEGDGESFVFRNKEFFISQIPIGLKKIEQKCTEINKRI